MKSELTPDEVEALLDNAEDVFPDSDFVSSVRDWFDEHGWITDGQETGLNNTIERGGR